ncbi:MAG: hypothetical protein IKH60_02455 [Bacteroidales bacterium]|nr:hypothetical protein [Bacteroidales bacterium]
MEDKNKYNWQYCSVGGVVRVKVSSGEDLAHLGELDQKLWTVLSLPTKGLEFDSKTLELLDADGDGKIRVPEVVSAAEWLTTVIKDRNSILEGRKALPLAVIDTGNEAGQKLYDSAKRVLEYLGLEKEEVALADIEDTTKIFAGTKFNGDGVITAVSTDDENLKKTIGQIIELIGQVEDRSGEPGVNAELIEQFFAAAEAYAAWQAAGAEVLPYGADTEAVNAAVEAVNAKVRDFFMRCKLIAFDDAAAPAVDVDVEKIVAIAGGNLADQAAEIAEYPIARPCKEQVLPFTGINPAWKAAVDTVKALVPAFADKKGVTEAEWEAVVAGLAPYNEWKAAKAGAEVEPLGLDEVKALLAADSKPALLALIESDKALEEEASGIDEVCKLVRYYANFSKLLNNYVILSDFYTRDPEKLAVFEAGKLYIDERCCDLCVRVEDMGKHADMAGLSNMFLIYCTCTSKVKAETMNIAAVMTAGSIRNLRPGVNGVFYDRDGQDWDAVITKVVDNPISVRQAFWSPYRKFGKFISDKINKSAADKDAKGMSTLSNISDSATNKPTEGVNAAAKAAPFDVAKFAGIAAMVTMAVAAVAGVLTMILKALKGLVWWKWLILIAVLMLIISGPACFIAWRKLRKRNLGPVLNANGWAINSAVLVNILFGKTLTSVAKYPKVHVADPYSMRPPLWKRLLRWLIFLLVVAFAVGYFTNNLKFMGIERKPKVEKVAEPVAEPEAAAAAVAAEAAPEAAPAEAPSEE